MVLHITNDFNLTKVHKELYCQLDKLGLKQTIYIPLRTQSQIGKNHFPFSMVGSEYIYSKTLLLYHKLLFRSKIDFLYQDLVDKIDCSKITLTHATTLFSDGAIAYRLYKDFGIPYIVAVRNTDLNIYFKYRKNLIGLGKKILINAKKVVFISNSNRITFNKIKSLKEIDKIVKDKITVINNGIDDFWINNIKKFVNKNKNSYNFLYIGRFDKNKNVEMLIDALKKFKVSHKKTVKLSLIGGTGNRHNNVLDKLNGEDWITYYGAIYNKSELVKHYLANDFFAMISKTETFGLVYMEALSQGLPLLYTEDQGIDKTFAIKFGQAVKCNNINHIIAKIDELCNDDYQSINNIDFEFFRWSKIALIYLKIYNEKN